ncbi:MAG TPA: protein kinase [Pyrinomonadaceae bacterium]|jgi:non-specific serine/threonine protein kinase
MALATGTRLGRYKIRSKLGEGGMGEVYLAEDTGLERIVALKVLQDEVASNRQRMSRFTQEARAASALNHPNILTIHEIGEASGTRFIATEFIDGTTLRARLTEARMEVFEALDVAGQVAAALAAAHAAGIVHRDIKPENIMLRPDGYVKVLDFGIAKLTEHKANTAATDSEAPTRVNTEPSVVMGTVLYMSPEQARGFEIDARTDIWSLGVVIYEMVTGRLPFDGETMSDVISSILRDEPAPLARYRQHIPAELERIIRKSLRKMREERYEAVGDLARDLKSLKQRLEFEAELERSLTPEESSEKIRTARAEVSRAVDQSAETLIESSPLSLHRHPNNLTTDLTPLVGREHETAEVVEMLRRADVRLVTLTGVGGTGKTRLARAVARAMLREFDDGVFFVELAAITDPALVASAIAQALGVKEAGATALKDNLKAYLKERNLLIVLDNFEQVADAAALVAELLASSPRLKALATSRVLLHLSAEHEYTVPPLALPETEQLPPVSELMSYAAIALFVERAQASKQGFTLTEVNARAVVEVCRRLDGLPLAIELAAARIKLLSPQMILARLDHSLKLLTGGARDMPQRQQTMKSAIKWSYDLLDEGERLLFSRLSVFAAGATLEAAEKVCNVEDDLGVEVLDGIASLADKSLLMQKEQAEGESRISMLELVREYALECLEQSGEADAIRERHASFYLALAEEAEPELLGVHQAEWLDKLEEEHDNLRAALRLLLERDAASALRLAVAVRRLWTRHGHLTEGRGWLEAALEKSVDAEAQVRTKALVGAGEMTRQQGDLAAARRFYEEALLVSKESGERRLVAASCRGLGMLAYMGGNLAAARPLFEEALNAFRELGDTSGVAMSLNALGELARLQGDLAAARPLYEEAIALGKQWGNENAVSVDLYNLGAVACLEGDLEEARACFRETIRIDQKLGDRARVSYSLDGFGALAVARREMRRAARLFGAADHLRQSSGYALEPLDRQFRDRYAQEARNGLGEGEYEMAEREGRALRMREAIALALNEAGDA